ncbi:MAG: TonB-dependent receptor [Hymenobacter sp.]
MKKVFGALELTGGLRYDTRQVSWNNFYVGPNPANGFEQAVGPGTTDANLQFTDFKRTYTGLSASLGGSYALGDKLVLRANIARGYRARTSPKSAPTASTPARTSSTWVIPRSCPNSTCRKILACCISRPILRGAWRLLQPRQQLHLPSQAVRG